MWSSFLFIITLFNHQNESAVPKSSNGSSLNDSFKGKIFALASNITTTPNRLLNVDKGGKLLTVFSSFSRNNALNTNDTTSSSTTATAISNLNTIDSPAPAPIEILRPPPEEVVKAFEQRILAVRSRFIEKILQSKYPTGTYTSYLYTWDSYLRGLKKMITGIGPGQGNWFYIGDVNMIEYGLVNMGAFLAHGMTQSIYFDACDEINTEMVIDPISKELRHPISNSCGQGGLSYQHQVCADEERGMQCDVDETMQIQGVTHAWWVGAPPSLYCSDKETGYWDNVTGLEHNERSFSNAAGRSDVKGCCWWGRGVLQVRGLCMYGKLNYFLGYQAELDGRPSMYPDINFCRNPGAICSDKRANELRWVSGMFYWSHYVQRNSQYNYIEKLKSFVDVGDFTDESFMNMLNSLLGGSEEENLKRKVAFQVVLTVFGLIEDVESRAQEIGNMPQ